MKFIYTHGFTCQFFDQSKTRSFTAWRNIFLKKLSTRWSVAERISTLLQHLNHRVENVIKRLVHTLAVRPSRYEALGKFGYASSNSYASFVLSKLPRASYLDEHTLTYEPIVYYIKDAFKSRMTCFLRSLLLKKWLLCTGSLIIGFINNTCTLTKTKATKWIPVLLKIIAPTMALCDRLFIQMSLSR